MNKNDTTKADTTKIAAGGQTVLITGAAKRLGAAMAKAFAASGYDVIIHYNRSVDKAAALCQQLQQSCCYSRHIQCDLSDAAATAELMQSACELTRDGSPVSVLVNNASIFNVDTIDKTTAAELQRNVAIHASAPLILSREMARLLAAAGSESNGVVINMLDARIHDIDPQHAAYHLSKRMACDITRLLALELAPAVRVNAIAPGLVLPPEGEDDSYLEKLKSSNPLNSYASEDDICEAAMYLASARFVTGQVIYIDGGRHIKAAVHH